MRIYEEDLPDGVHNFYNDYTNLLSSSILVKDGKRHGTYFIYHKNGKLYLESNYKEGIQHGPFYIYNDNGVLVREEHYIDGDYNGDAKDYHDNGSLRMIQDKNYFQFFDENSKKRCEIFIKTKNVTKEEHAEIYPETVNNCWFKFIGIMGFRCLYLPFGVWRNYNVDGSIDFELDFQDNQLDLNPTHPIKMTKYNQENNDVTEESVIIKKFIPETFGSFYNASRLIYKKAKYPLIHFNPGGWTYNEFVINPVFSLNDIVTFEKTS
jgi:antitoxin component YwqK of YwqJK toxin-antitoxin module